MHADLGAVLTALEPELGLLRGEPEPLDGGITNRNFRIGDVVVRLPGKDTALLGIDRPAEREATAAAAVAGVGPEVVAFLAEPPCLVTRFIVGRPLPAEELRDPELLGEVAAALRAVHAGAPLAARFDAFAIVAGYRETAVARGARVPDVYDELAAGARSIADALTGPEHEPVPCHNDLLPANFIGTADGRLVILDWEYAGMGDRRFDLANFAMNTHTATEHGNALVLSLLREAMWGVVQASASDIEFDFAGYAEEHFARLAG